MRAYRNVPVTLIELNRFRWVSCQLDYLCELSSDAERRKALSTLPPTLDETYKRIFQRINLLPDSCRDLVQRTLQWLIGGPRLNCAELREAVSIKDGDEEIDPEAIPDVKEILLRCSSLVRLSVDGGFVELAHFTVEEYLCGPALKSDPELAQFHYAPKEARLGKIRTCLTCINMDQLSGMARTREQLEEKIDSHPFYNAASRNWYGILPEGDFGLREWSLVQKLFSPKQTQHVHAWTQVVADDVAAIRFEDLPCKDIPLADLNIALRASPLHLACMLACPTLVKWLIDEGCDVNEHCPAIGVPLHRALITYQNSCSSVRGAKDTSRVAGYWVCGSF